LSISESFIYYDGSKEIIYKLNENNYDVISHSNYEPISGVSYEEEYSFIMNFFYIDGWDSVSLNYDYEMILHFENEVVFEEYDIIRDIGPWNTYGLYTEIVVNEEDLDSAVFPDEFDESKELSYLFSELDRFMELEDPLDLIINDLMNDIEERKVAIEDRFKIE